MRTLPVRVLLILFALLASGAANAQTPPTNPPSEQRFSREFKLGETWPETPLFTALRSEVEKVWVQKGESWFTREENGIIQQIDRIKVGITHYGGKSERPEDLDGELSISFEWERERFYIPNLGQWTPWLGNSYVHFSLAIREGQVVPGKLRHHYAILSQAKRTISNRPELDEVKMALSRPEMTGAEFKGLTSDRPRVISLPKPESTPEAVAAHMTGSVILSVEVLPDGNVGGVKILRSIGYGLDENAIAAIRKGKFKPGLRFGQPINAKIRVEVTFSRQSSPFSPGTQK
jgi:TonB family protein